MVFASRYDPESGLLDLSESLQWQPNRLDGRYFRLLLVAADRVLWGYAYAYGTYAHG